MATTKPTRKISRKEKLREDTVATFYARAVGFFDRHKSMVYGAGGAVVVILAAVAGLAWMSAQKESRAAEAAAPSIRNYEAGMYREALDGVAGSAGLLEIAETFSSTETGNLAHFYAADALYRLGEFDQAIELFRQYDKDRDYLGASALAGEANILEGRGQHAEAGALYVRAAEFHEDAEFSPRYLVDAGRAFESAGEYGRAVEIYERVKAEYPDAQVASDADFLIARASARVSG